jgi:uncharacterized membrane protein YagU involved in acid resistance
MKIILAILLGGLLAGAGDIAYACIHYNLVYGTPPQRILQSVAAGVMGTEAARAGGWTSAGIGLGAHFFLTTMMATAFVLASLYAPLLRRWWWITGPVYGIGVMLVMNLIVVPMSAVRSAPQLPEDQFLYGAIFAHTILVGLVIALIARVMLSAGDKPATQ